MLEHQKLVISNVSYDENLFEKELFKSIKWLKVSELYKLFDWLKNRYWKTHSQIILNVLKTI